MRSIGGRQRVVLYLRHPAAYGKVSTVESAYRLVASALRDVVAGRLGVENFAEQAGLTTGSVAAPAPGPHL